MKGFISLNIAYSIDFNQKEYSIRKMTGIKVDIRWTVQKVSDPDILINSHNTISLVFYCYKLLYRSQICWRWNIIWKNLGNFITSSKKEGWKYYFKHASEKHLDKKADKIKNNHFQSSRIRMQSSKRSSSKS